MCQSPKKPIILGIQIPEKLREMRLEKYLQKQKSKLIHRESLLRRESKSTWMLLQKINGDKSFKRL